VPRDAMRHADLHETTHVAYVAMVEHGRTTTPGWPVPVVARTEAGLRVATLERPGPVVAVRLTVGVGSRHGCARGGAHMHEHLIFRTREGSRARREIEALGGEVGATTTREQTSIDAIVIPADVPAALGAMARLAAARPTLGDLDRERPVVQRELAHEAEERRRIWQLLSEALYGVDHPLAYPILGTLESLAAIGIDDLDQVRDRWRAGNAALAIVGPVEQSAVLESAEAILQANPGAAEDARDPRPDPVGRRHEERRSGLLHIACGWRFGGVDDDNLPALRIAEIVLAHGSGSRLYDQLRTRRRLAYRVSTVLIPYRDSGFLAAVTACDPHHASQAEAAVIGEVERLASRGPTFPELEAARRQLHGSLARAYEVSRRLAGLAATQLLFDRLEPVDDLFARIAACEPADIASAASALVGPGQTHAIASIGRHPG
jgi:predicted Zn-dependent peptidase